MEAMMADRSVKADPIGPADDTILTNHRMVREDGHWRCVHCLQLGNRHVPPAPCVSRRWGDQ
jgi:hypothetical protein